jgi:hypothetical protein
MVCVNLRSGNERQSRVSRRRRPATVGLRRMTRERGRLAVLVVDDGPSRLPETRGECRGGARPCPLVSCRYHLYLDVTEHGSIRLNFPGLEPWELTHSCALDVAEASDGHSLEAIGALLNVTRERARQLEAQALTTIGGDVDTYADNAAVDETAAARRRR